MRKAVVRLMTAVSIGVLVAAFEASGQGTARITSAAPAGVVADPQNLPSTAAAPKPTATTNPQTVTVNGVSVDTRYGPVQVQVKIRNGRIIFADAIDYPQSDQRSREISAYAVPELNQETLDAQSASVDTVSGASYTSDGYRQSLQSALDAAHLGR